MAFFQESCCKRLSGRSGTEDADLQRLLGIYCPGYLLPYARQTISDLLTKGGFPPFLLPPVNFEALYQRAGDAPPVTKN